MKNGPKKNLTPFSEILYFRDLSKLKKYKSSIFNGAYQSPFFYIIGSDWLIPGLPIKAVLNYFVNYHEIPIRIIPDFTAFRNLQKKLNFFVNSNYSLR